MKTIVVDDNIYISLGKEYKTIGSDLKTAVEEFTKTVVNMVDSHAAEGEAANNLKRFAEETSSQLSQQIDDILKDAGDKSLEFYNAVDKADEFLY